MIPSKHTDRMFLLYHTNMKSTKLVSPAAFQNQAPVSMKQSYTILIFFSFFFFLLTLLTHSLNFHFSLFFCFLFFFSLFPYFLLSLLNLSLDFTTPYISPHLSSSSPIFHQTDIVLNSHFSNHIDSQQLFLKQNRN